MRQRKRCPPPAPSKSPPTHCRPRPFENEPSALAPLPAASSPRPSRGLRPRASPLHPLVPETRPFPRSVQVVDENKAPAQVRRRAPSHLFCVGQDRASPPRVARCAATHSRALSAPPPLFSFRPSALPPLPPFAASSPCAARRPPRSPAKPGGSGGGGAAASPSRARPSSPEPSPSFLPSFFPSFLLSVRCELENVEAAAATYPATEGYVALLDSLERASVVALRHLVLRLGLCKCWFCGFNLPHTRSRACLVRTS